MTGAAIPVGETEICTLHSNNTHITQVVLSDANADAIPASIEGVASGIEESMVNGQWSMDNDKVYDLSGRKVNSVGAGPVPARTRKGLYILNGTKIVNK